MFICLLALTLSAQQTLSGQTSSQPSPAPVPRTLSRSPMRLALPRREYLCDGGAKIVILIGTNAVRLTLNEHIYNMKKVEASSGQKYAEGAVVWSTDSDSGVLEEESVTGQPQILAANCHLQSSYPPATPAAGKVTGTVTYGQKPALPPDAVIVVHLEDVFLPDVPSPFLAEFKTTVGGRQVPIPFTLNCDPAKIDPQHPYIVEASILVHDQLRFTNDTAYPVLTQGHPARVDMILVPVGAPQAARP